MCKCVGRAQLCWLLAAGEEQQVKKMMHSYSFMLSSLRPCQEEHVARSVPCPILVLPGRHSTHLSSCMVPALQSVRASSMSLPWDGLLGMFFVSPSSYVQTVCSSVLWNVLLRSWGNGKQTVKSIISILNARFKNHQWNTFQYNIFFSLHRDYLCTKFTRMIHCGEGISFPLLFS